MLTRRHALSLLALAAFVTTAAVSTAACASTPTLVDVQVVDRSAGGTLPLWRYRGESYVAGQPGTRYALRLTNRSAERVMVVLSVDGVNAVTGDTAAVSQGGYVLAPWQSYEVIGWRKSNAETAAFYFTALADSYAARTGRPDNVGVIGAAVFRERRSVGVAFEAKPSTAPRSPAGEGMADRASRQERRADDSSAATDMNRRSDAAPASPMGANGLAAAAPAARTPAPLERLGTGHGEREYSRVEDTSFDRASSRPDAVISIRYDSYEQLLASGVIGRPVVTTAPSPFPHFVPDPR